MCATRHENNVARSAYKKEAKSKESTAASSSSESAPTTTPTSTPAGDKPNFRKAVSGRENPLEVEGPKQDKPKRQSRKPVAAAPAEEGWTKVEPKKTAPSKPRGKKQDAK